MADTTAAPAVVVQPVPALDPAPQVRLVNPLTLRMADAWPDDLPSFDDADAVSAPVNQAGDTFDDEAQRPYVLQAVDRYLDQTATRDGDGTGAGNGHRRGSWSAAGVKWFPQMTGSGGAGTGLVSTGGDVQDACSVPAVAGTPTVLPQQQSNALLLREFYPVTSFYASDAEIMDSKGRAAAALSSLTSAKIAREFWKGTLAAARQWSNPFLTRTGFPSQDPRNPPGVAGQSPAPAPPLVRQVVDGNGVGGGKVNNLAAFAALEQAIATYGRGDPGVIYCTRRCLMIWNWYVKFQNVGGLLVTPAGNIVIADAGFDGSAPADPPSAPRNAPFFGSGNPDASGTTEWAFCTGLPAVKVSDIESSDVPVRVGDVVPPDNRGVGGIVDRNLDNLVVVAYRYAAYTFDPAILAGVLIDHTVPLTSANEWTAQLV